MSKPQVECLDCDGSGLIEGQEWNGEKCRTCHGSGWVDEAAECSEDERYYECPTCGNAVPHGMTCHHNL